MSSQDMAVVAIAVYRSPALSGGIVTDQEPYLSGLLMVPPLPVSSEQFLAYSLQSARRTWETMVFANAANILPDIDDGDKIKDIAANKWYTVRGVSPWQRPEGGSFLSILLDELKVNA